MTNVAYLAEGERTRVRRLGVEDREEFVRRARESRALHHPWLAPPTSERAFAGYAARLAEPSRAGFAVCERESGALAGYVTINNMVGGAFRCGAVGYGAFAHAAGRGLMSEGLSLVLGRAFGPMELHRLEANIQPGNELSRALVRRLGFRLEGFSPDFLYVNGAWRDHERWAITREMAVGGAPAGSAAEQLH